MDGQQRQRPAAQTRGKPEAPPLWLPAAARDPDGKTTGYTRAMAVLAEQKRKTTAKAARTSIVTIDEMSGKDFENYVAGIFRRNGWDVSDTPATGDYGVDLVAAKDDRRVAVQCKRHGKPVGISAVQEAVSGAAHYHCNASMVVSNQEFTQAAAALANTHNCALVGRSTLAIITYISE